VKLWTCQVTGVTKPEGAGWFHIRANRHFCVSRYSGQPKFRRWMRVYGKVAVKKAFDVWADRRV